MPKATFEPTFQTLRAILKRHEAKLTVVADKLGHYSLDAGLYKKGRALCFGAVKINKSYVSFYLMPIYVFPDLAGNLSAELAARRQGKSCFNFKTVDAGLVRELTRLTRAGLRRFQQEGLL